jgi:Fic family protein
LKPFIPDALPIKHLDFARLLGLVGQANAELARYDGLLQGIVNPTILLSPLMTQEAVLSSKIEGTQATLDEVLEHEAGMKMDCFFSCGDYRASARKYSKSSENNVPL